jgi:penicillin-binding protein 2
MNEPAIFFEDVNERQGGFLRRTFLMGGFTALGLGALTTRLGYLQLVESSHYRTLSAHNQFNYRIVPPPRGRILDRNGVVLAGNRPSFRVLVIRDEIKDLPGTLDLVGTLLPATMDRRHQIINEINASPHFMPVAVATDLSWDDFARVNLHAPQLPGVVADMNESRYYPNPGAFAHVIGYVAKISDDDVKKAKATHGGEVDPILLSPGFRIGKQGIEKAFDLQLRGVPGGQKVEVDSKGRVVGEDSDGDRRAVPGDDIVLTLDSDIQSKALEVFGADSGAAVMMDVRTGDVLCLLSAPSFDVNAFVSGVPGQTYKSLSGYDHRPLLNKALNGLFPAGSTFKTMVAMAALEKGISPDKTHTCGGSWQYGNHVFHCDSAHGTLNMHRAIVTSCDVFFFQTAVEVGIENIATMARKFGINEVFEEIHIGQSRGTMPTPEWKMRETHQPWYPGDVVSVGIGQGALQVNPLQLCVMVSRLANGKKALRPRLIKSVGGKEFPRGDEAPDIAVDPAHMAYIRSAMAGVTSEPGGTAAHGELNLDLGDIKIAGKTGTAQDHTYKIGGSRSTKGAAWSQKDHGWFIAFAPADDPRYAMAVLVQHGGFGATIAAPKVREIMRTALLKDPDIVKRIGGVIPPDKDAPKAEKAAESDENTDIPVDPTPVVPGAPAPATAPPPTTQTTAGAT